MADTITIPDNLRAKATEKGWPDDLVQQALAAGAAADQIIGYMDQGVTAEQARAVPRGAGAAAAPSRQKSSRTAAERRRMAGRPRAAGARGRAQPRPTSCNFMNMGVTADQARAVHGAGRGQRNSSRT